MGFIPDIRETPFIILLRRSGLHDSSSILLSIWDFGCQLRILPHGDVKVGVSIFAILITGNMADTDLVNSHAIAGIQFKAQAGFAKGGSFANKSYRTR